LVGPHSSDGVVVVIGFNSTHEPSLLSCLTDLGFSVKAADSISSISEFATVVISSSLPLNDEGIQLLVEYANSGNGVGIFYRHPDAKTSINRLLR
jgi:ribosome-interacting GTPase 1